MHLDRFHVGGAFGSAAGLSVGIKLQPAAVIYIGAVGKLSGIAVL